MAFYDFIFCFLNGASHNVGSVRQNVHGTDFYHLDLFQIFAVYGSRDETLLPLQNN